MVPVIFHYQNNFKHNFCLVHLCNLVATSKAASCNFFSAVVSGNTQVTTAALFYLIMNETALQTKMQILRPHT
jgi:hypothetical protein